MSTPVRIALAQLNLVVGDIQGNLQKHIHTLTTAESLLHANVIVFPELSLCGYPAEDLLKRPAFLDECDDALHQLQQHVDDLYCIVGYPERSSQGLYNACAVIHKKEIIARYRKHHLPNYGVFDEKRYFISGNTSHTFSLYGIPTRVVICEDLWHSDHLADGAQLILSPNASPFEVNKDQERQRMLLKHAVRDQISLIYVNQVGGQDDLVFDGGSLAVTSEGVSAKAQFFHEEILCVDYPLNPTPLRKAESDEEKIYRALVLGVRDYVQKNHFPGVLVGVSGGIDSALTLAIAVDALGNENVHAVILPSRFTADISLEDGLALIKNLGVHYDSLSIESTFSAFLETLAPVMKHPNDIVGQNLQARCRGMIMMAISNQTGKLVLTTSNRSEMAVGYSTLYGDMAGGFAVLKDIPKMAVYRLVRYRNSLTSVIPQRILERAPTAELAHDQTDEENLAPYPILDDIIHRYIDLQQSVKEICEAGFEKATVEKITSLIRLNEYKRRQAPVGPRVNHFAFGRDRRYPITCGYIST